MAKVTVTSYLNARTDMPSPKAPNPSYLSPGALLEIDDAVCGEEIEGNCIWYHSTDGSYYWSGGTQNTNFILEGKSLDHLAVQDQLQVVGSLKNEISNSLENRSGINGCSVGRKNGVLNGPVCLLVYVNVKQPTNDPDNLIPDFISYRGYSIPTDVVETHDEYPERRPAH